MISIRIICIIICIPPSVIDIKSFLDTFICVRIEIINGCVAYINYKAIICFPFNLSNI